MFPHPADPFRARLADTQTLSEILPWVVDSLSIARGQMLVDQLAKTVQSNGLQNLLIVVVEKATPEASSGPPFTVFGAVIAQINVPESKNDAGDLVNRTATVLFAGRAPHSFLAEYARKAKQGEEVLFKTSSLLSAALDSELSARGVQFIQWAQDPSEELGTGPVTRGNGTRDDRTRHDRTRDNDSAIVEKSVESTSFSRDSWPELLGFQQLATLSYMRCDVRNKIGGHCEPPPESLRIAAIGHSAEEKLRFESLVERTYVGTLDCPSLSQFQTTAGTLDGYRASPVFSPDLWFEVTLAPTTTVGCLILARHGGAHVNVKAEASGERPVEGARGVLEVVYMGVVPEHRGRGFGAQLVKIALDLARQAGCESIILAVDTKNSPARASYEAAGFVPVLLEEVWGKRLLVDKIEASKNEST